MHCRVNDGISDSCELLLVVSCCAGHVSKGQINGIDGISKRATCKVHDRSPVVEVMKTAIY